MPERASDLEPRVGSAVRVLLAFLAAYKRLISPLFTGLCRFVPSCSTYAAEAVARHGAVVGSWLTVKRLARCHPLCRGGLDQVPMSRQSEP